MSFLFVWVNHTTLSKKWQYNFATSLLEPDLPGRLSEGTIDMGIYQQAHLLVFCSHETSWITLAHILVANGAEYRHLTPSNCTRLGGWQTITTASQIALFDTTVVLVAIVILRLAIAFVFIGDKRLQLDSIDGLSSIVREEAKSSGWRSIRGHTSYEASWLAAMVHYGLVRLWLKSGCPAHQRYRHNLVR